MNLDAIPDATPDQEDAARNTLATWVLTGRVDKDTARLVASALDLHGDNVTHLPAAPRRTTLHTRRTTVKGHR